LTKKLLRVGSSDNNTAMAITRALQPQPQPTFSYQTLPPVLMRALRLLTERTIIKFIFHSLALTLEQRPQVSFILP
jgi:hypothetical protein